MTESNFLNQLDIFGHPRRICLDLDGVFANMAKAAKELHGEDYLTMSKTKFWLPIINKIDNFFYHLEKIPGSDKILEVARSYPDRETMILTALPIPVKKTATAKEDKIRWVRENLSTSIRIETVIGGKNKAKFCKSPDDILIDDLKRNIDAWKAAGGIGILHVDNDQTVDELRWHVSRSS